MGAFVSLRYMLVFSTYQQIGKRLLSMKTVGSMDVERTAKPFKHCKLSKDRNRLSDERGVVLFRAGQNLKHLHHARESIKGKVYTEVLGVDGVTAALVSQAQVVDENLD